MRATALMQQRCTDEQLVVFVPSLLTHPEVTSSVGNSYCAPSTLKKKENYYE